MRFPLYGAQGKFTYRLLSVALFGQAIILSFFALVARANALAAGDAAAATTRLRIGLALALFALVAAALMRRPYGITLGWLVQILTWASALVVPAMIGVALVFTGLWLLLLWQGRKSEEILARRYREATGSEAG